MELKTFTCACGCGSTWRALPTSKQRFSSVFCASGADFNGMGANFGRGLVHVDRASGYAKENQKEADSMGLTKRQLNTLKARERKNKEPVSD